MDAKGLIEAAQRAREKAYAPYSKFAVGAAVLTAEGEVFTGCNVENISFGLTCCAERNAIFAAVAAGRRNFVTIAIAADTVEPVSPCGACRQVMAEFAEDLEIICATPSHSATFRLTGLLPRAKTGILDSPSST